MILPSVVSCKKSVMPMRWSARATLSTGPLSANSDCQAIVRSRKLVKNGTMTRPSSRFRHRPALKAMKYASG